MSKGCQEIPRQGKDLPKSQNLMRVVAIYKTNNMSLKTRRLEKVLYVQNVADPDLFFVSD